MESSNAVSFITDLSNVDPEILDEKIRDDSISDELKSQEIHRQ